MLVSGSRVPAFWFQRSSHPQLPFDQFNPKGQGKGEGEGARKGGGLNLGRDFRLRFSFAHLFG